MKVSLPQLLWYGNTTLEMDLPDDWDVELCPMRGAKRKPLNVKEMEDAIHNPIGSPRLKDLARNKKTAVIIFDDITRPTRVYELAPIVIRELTAGGIDEEDITFVCALGTHGAHNFHEFRKKLGSEIVENFRVFNHNIYENCVEVGTTSRGTKMMINREFAQADVKVGIGCVTAHAQVGFSGGGKIILPGISHIDSISHYHLDVEALDPDSTGLGKFDNNVLRFDIEEAVRLAGLDFKVDVIVNDRGATTEVFAGDVLEEHAQAVKLAKDIYATEPRPRGKDLAIANAFAKPNEMSIAIGLGFLSTLSPLNEEKDSGPPKKGTVVVVADAPEGQIVHYLLGRWGRNYGGRQYPVWVLPSDLVDVIVIAPHLNKNFGDWVGNPEVITWRQDWESTMDLLKESFGAGTKVAVLPTATMQYFDS